MKSTVVFSRASDESLPDRFWSKVQKGDGCWLWTAHRQKNNGYGKIRMGGKYGRLEFAHRLSWQIHYGDVPDGLRVLHRCDVPACVRPDHLFLGTQQENNADREAKGRGNTWGAVASRMALWSKKSDLWTTPRVLFDRLDAEFGFDLDAAAVADDALCQNYRGPDHEQPDYRDALTCDWAPSTWLNCPYSLVSAFVAKAAEEAAKGCTVVALLPARTDTRWWHAYIWDGVRHQPRPGVEVRFLRGRLKFSDSTNSAPFPSAVVVFRCPT